MVNNTTHNIIKNTKDISRESNTVNTNIAARTQEMIANFESRGFSKGLIQDIINSISATDRNHPTYGRADLLNKEIEKAHFLLTVVDNSTKEELDEYISELANSKHNIHRYQNNKNIAEKYKNYIGKTLYMLEEKDVKLKKDFDNIIILQAELIKTNTLLQAFSRYEQGAGGASFSELGGVKNIADFSFTPKDIIGLNQEGLDKFYNEKTKRNSTRTIAKTEDNSPMNPKESGGHNTILDILPNDLSALMNTSHYELPVADFPPTINEDQLNNLKKDADLRKKTFGTKSLVNLGSSFEKMKNDVRKFGNI